MNRAGLTGGSLTAELVSEALTMALWRRGKPEALMHHSDRGSQYTSELSTIAGRTRRRLLDEPGRQLLGQCGDRELLLFAENRAHGAQDLPDAR